MKIGDAVRVYPHGSPAQAATAKILLLSENEASISVAFEHLPPFARGWTVHPKHGVVMLAHRQMVDGKPLGPWIELFGRGHYEMELVSDGDHV